MSRIMQKEIKSEMNDFFFAKDHLDFYHEYVNVEQKYGEILNAIPYDE